MRQFGAAFALSLMGANIEDFIRKAHRVLNADGIQFLPMVAFALYGHSYFHEMVH